MSKVTKEQRNLDIINLLTGNPVEFGTTIEEAINHLEHENELLMRKNGGSKSAEAIALANTVFRYLPEPNEEGKTIFEIIKSSDELSDYSTQKITPIVNRFVESDKAVKYGVKGRSYFKKK